MKQDSIEWLGERLSLALVREDECGATANAAARSLLGREAYPNLGAFLRHVLGEGFNRVLIDESVSRARAGTRSELSVASGARVLLSQDANAHVVAVYLPARTTTSSVPPARATHPDIAAGVSHELANALGAIAGWARLAKQGRRVQEALDLIEMSAESAWSAAQRMLRDVRNQRDGAQESVDLSAFVDEAARLLGPKAMGRSVQIRTAIAPGLRVRGDRGNAWSIVWNLAANAVEALPPGGVVELRLASVGAMAVLEVEDNGPGMSPEHRMRAFEPYFTTKPAGTGLGLALVRQAATEVGGSVALESELGHGARFTVELPLTAGTSTGSRQASAKRSSGVFYAEPLHQRILVVDDDLGLREMISTALGMRGAEVVAVHDAETALVQEGSFAVAIVDLLLPGMRGDALLARLRERRSIDVGVLMTGSELPNTAAEGRPDVLLRKPFELEELFESLATAVTTERGNRGSLVG